MEVPTEVPSNSGREVNRFNAEALLLMKVPLTSHTFLLGNKAAQKRSPQGSAVKVTTQTASQVCKCDPNGIQCNHEQLCTDHEQLL